MAGKGSILAYYQAENFPLTYAHSRRQAHPRRIRGFRPRLNLTKLLRVCQLLLDYYDRFYF